MFQISQNPTAANSTRGCSEYYIFGSTLVYIYIYIYIYIYKGCAPCRRPPSPKGEDVLEDRCYMTRTTPGLSGTIFGANMELSWVQVGAKSGPSWIQVGAKTGPRRALGEAQASRIDFDRFLEPTWGQVGAKLEPSWPQNRVHTGMFFRSSFWTQFYTLLGSILDTFWAPFWSPKANLTKEVSKLQNLILAAAGAQF